MKCGTLTSMYSELERLKQENWRLERQCNDVSRRLELAAHDSANESKVSYVCGRVIFSDTAEDVQSN